tara:strand:+ start:720 stop:2354 length:1635 start_codon:yes stop_codon:yes gene_type:complete
MIFELSKDKSLLYVLSKVELDEETKALVNEKASPLEIKKSLVKNINPSNIIQYRRYIKKADEQTEIAETFNAESEEEGARSQVGDITQDKETRERIESAEYGDMVNTQAKEKDAYKELSIMFGQLDGLRKISETARVSKDNNKLTILSAMKGYNSLGTTKASSEKLLDLVRLMKKDPNYLTTRHAKVLADFKGDKILSGKTFNKDKDTGRVAAATDNDKKDINVSELENNLNAIIGLEFNVMGEEGEKIPFPKVLERLHVQRWKREPANLQNRPKRKKELQGIQYRLKGKSPKAEKEYTQITRKLSKLSTQLNKIRLNKASIDEKIEEMEELKEEWYPVLKKKLDKLNTALRTLLSQGKNLTPEEIREKTSQIRELQENPKKYLDEAKEEYLKDLETEKSKLERFSIDLAAADRVKEPLKEFRTINNMFRENDPIDSVKKLLTKGMNLCSKIQFKARGIAVISSNADDKVSEGLTAYIMDNPEVASALFDDDMEIEGLATIDIQTMRKVDDLAAQMDIQSQELQEVVNQLNQMIQGEKPAGDEE